MLFGHAGVRLQEPAQTEMYKNKSNRWKEPLSNVDHL